MRLFLLALLCSGFILGCSNEPDPLRIGSNRWLGYAPFYIADELGWTSSANVRLIEYSSSNGVTRSMYNGLLDAALLTLDEAITLQSTGHNIEILLITNISAGANVLYAHPSIRHVDDLKGKRIAVEGGTVGTYFLSRILDTAKLTVNDIQIVNIPTYMHNKAFKEDAIDATINTAAVRTQLHQSGALPLFSSRDLRGEIIDVLVVNRERSTPRLRKRIRALWFSSLETWLEHRSKIDPRVSQRLGLDEQSLTFTLSRIAMGDKALNNLYFEHGLLAASIDKIQAYMLGSGLLKQPIDSNHLLSSCAGDAC